MKLSISNTILFSKTQFQAAQSLLSRSSEMSKIISAALHSTCFTLSQRLARNCLCVEMSLVEHKKINVISFPAPKPCFILPINRSPGTNVGGDLSWEDAVFQHHMFL